MGVKTHISLDELNDLFSSYSFTKIQPTSSGIMDTTYIVHAKTKAYILKKYERDISQKISRDIKLLAKLKSAGLNVPVCIDEKSGWYLYEKLQGKEPKNITTYHIQALARFLAKLHNKTYKMTCQSSVMQNDEISKLLRYAKKDFYCYYKRVEFLKEYKEKNDGLIHTDIFKDNTVFDGRKIGVFDFIDSSSGSFAFDAAVALIGFGLKEESEYFINLFLRCYNQHAPKKLTKKNILKMMRTASHYYALKRINKYKNSSKAKELIRYI